VSSMCVSEQIVFNDSGIIATPLFTKLGPTMKIKLATSCFVICTVLAPFAAHAADSDSDRAHPVAFVKDSVVTTKIKTKLVAEKIDSLVHIRVDTDRKGAVILRGKVRSQEEADRAISIARNTEGVTSVKSKMHIKKED